MKSNLKILIAGAVLLVVLIAAVIVLNSVGVGDEENTEETTTTAVQELSKLLYDKDPVTIENIHVKNSTGEYDIKKYADDAWFIPEFMGHNHNTSAVSTALESAATVTSQQVASENASDLSVYGLDAPRAEVTIEFDDDAQTVKKMLIGADSPSSGLTYICFDGENTVHAVNTSEIECYFNDKFYYIAKTVYTAKQPADASDTTNYSKIDSITISRKDIDYDIVLEYDIRQDSEDIVSGNSSSHIMTSPVRLDLNPDASYNVINNVFGLTASKVAVVSPSDETLAQFGLDDPFAEVSFDIVGGDFRLLIGDEYTDENGNKSGYYCYADGFDIIYIFDKASIPWAEVMPLDITMSMITTTYVYNISTIDIETADIKKHFVLNGDSENFKVTCDDMEISGDNFKNYYQYILRAPAEELYLESTAAAADIKITIAHSFGTDVIEFIPSEDRKSIIRVNGVTSFKCRTVYADRLIENLNHLLNGEDIVTTW